MKRQRWAILAGKYHLWIWAIRALLLFAILANLVTVILYLINEDFSTTSELVRAISKNIDTIFWALITFGLTFLHDYFEAHHKVHIPGIVEAAMVTFLYASIFLSAYYDLFYTVWWWDIFLHTTSGVFLGFFGFLLIYKINSKFSMNISPLLVALFALTSSVTMNVLFEIYEFSMDLIFETAMQSWDLPNNTVEIGRSFQGIGLRDTMSDLIVDTMGAVAVSVVCFFLYRDEKRKALTLLKGVFPPERTSRRHRAAS